MKLSLRIILSWFLVLISFSSQGYEIYHGPSKYSDSAVLVNSAGSAVSAATPMAVQQTATPTAPPILQQDLIGNTSNYYPTKGRGFTFGRALLVQNVRVDLWEGPTGLYVFPAAPQQMRIVSSSSVDNGTGAGVQRVHIHYLDTNYAIQNEQITLNGLTPVNTVATNILRINGMHAIQAGTGGTSAGNISLTNLAGTVTYGYISAGTNTARQAIYTIPAGKTGYVNHWQASSGSSGNHFCQIEMRATTHDGALWPTVFLIQDNVGTQNGAVEINFPIPIPMPATTDVKLSAVCDASNSNATAMGAIMGWFE